MNEKSTTFTRTSLDLLMTEILPISNYVKGLSFEVYNSFLPQLAWNWQTVKVGSPKKCLNYDDYCSKTQNKAVIIFETPV